MSKTVQSRPAFEAEERGRTSLPTFSGANPADIERFFDANRTMMQNMVDINRSLFDFVDARFKSDVAVFDELCKCKDWQEASKVQSRFMSGLTQQYFDQVMKLKEAATKLLATQRAAAIPAVAELAPAAQLLAEGARRKTDLLDKANKGVWVGTVSELLRISRQAVNKRRKAGKLIAVPSGSDYLYPTCQFSDKGLLEGLEQALRVMPIKDPWMRLEWLLTEDDVLNGQSPLEALKAGRVEEVIELAAGHGGE